MIQLWESLLSRLRDYCDPERLGAIVGEILVKLVLAAIILTLFYLIWRGLNKIITLRLNIAVTVAVTEDLDRARKILLSTVQSDADYLVEPLPRVVVTQLNDYNVGLELQVWLRDERRHVEKRFKLRERVFKALTDGGVEMPFETIQLAPHRVAVAVSSNGIDNKKVPIN